jgi:hypothetical protein
MAQAKSARIILSFKINLLGVVLANGRRLGTATSFCRLMTSQTKALVVYRSPVVSFSVKVAALFGASRRSCLLDRGLGSPPLHRIREES